MDNIFCVTAHLDSKSWSKPIMKYDSWDFLNFFAAHGLDITGIKTTFMLLIGYHYILHWILPWRWAYHVKYTSIQEKTGNYFPVGWRLCLKRLKQILSLWIFDCLFLSLARTFCLWTSHYSVNVPLVRTEERLCFFQKQHPSLLKRKKIS